MPEWVATTLPVEHVVQDIERLHRPRSLVKDVPLQEREHVMGVVVAVVVQTNFTLEVR